MHGILFAILLNQSLSESKKANQNHTRIILASWILTALVLCTAYSSSFYSILIVPKYGQAIDTIDDLLQVVREDSKFVVLGKKSIYWYHIVNAEPDNFVSYEIQKHLNR